MSQTEKNDELLKPSWFIDKCTIKPLKAFLNSDQTLK